MITKAIERAYRTARERNWDKVYWAIDLHGVCFPNNYTQNVYEFINEKAIEGLQAISNRKESIIILWSSAWGDQQQPIVDFFDKHDILVNYFNENPLVQSTYTGCFAKKFYFSILLDDKAGFDPSTDWQVIIDHMKNQESL
jgi:hypothetical protein